MKSRHPRIQYWYMDPVDLVPEEYEPIIDRLAEDGTFDTLALTCHDGIDFWDYKNVPVLTDVARYAKERGIRTVLQVWPHGFHFRAGYKKEEGIALVTEHECTVRDGKVALHSVCTSARYTKSAPRLTSELLLAVAFEKTDEGVYRAGTEIDIRPLVSKQESTDDGLCLEFSLNSALPDGYTAYVLVAHYYDWADYFSEAAIRDFRELIESYRGAPLSGIVLDEFKNMPILPPWEISAFRDRYFGDHFARYYESTTGKALSRELFDMRYCPEGKDEIRIAAINRYFDVLRRSTLRMEKFIAEESKRVFGADAFAGLHNTFHNHLNKYDEIWATGCAWWDVPREYAQTDESIPFPVRMGMACTCPENLVYDMFYSKRADSYLEKAIADAPYGSRITYHDIARSNFCVNTGSEEFLKRLHPIEEKIELLNAFDPAMPKMELLVVFGFPALCNWYPNTEARSTYDINGSLDIMERTDALWKAGYLNALAPDDAILDGRITRDADGFLFSGHRFEKLLYLYPEYSHRETVRFLEEAVEAGAAVHVIGELTHDFDGVPLSSDALRRVTLGEDADIAAALSLSPCEIEGGCILEDGSAVMTDATSLLEGGYATRSFMLKGYRFEATFCGALAMRCDERGEITRLAAGNLIALSRDGISIPLENAGEDLLILK